MDDFTPPSPSAITLLATSARTLLTGLGGMGIGVGIVVSDAQLTAISAMVLTVGSALLWVATWLWSIYQKVRAKQLDHAASVASAEASANASIATGKITPIVMPAPPGA